MDVKIYMFGCGVEPRSVNRLKFLDLIVFRCHLVKVMLRGFNILFMLLSSLIPEVLKAPTLPALGVGWSSEHCFLI